ncbi:ribonuclease J [Solibaculum mannosilyticum]|uniref:Ribonuclease J n=1 Tax=Solibaculum mannosilyticum TaxID=2780922 RepID=A0A7I8D236_9FIRM|nr:ribonuclease J [Solibaculum mannosilyticum]BCI60887.1 ribonuclease J [Solibaculum mannosilyticum]
MTPEIKNALLGSSPSKQEEKTAPPSQPRQKKVNKAAAAPKPKASAKKEKPVQKKEGKAKEQAKQQPRQSAKQGKEKSAGTGRQRNPRGKQDKRSRIPAKDQKPVRIYYLGGLNEIGKNMTLFECGDDMFIVDCGLAFPDDDMLGVDLVIPDFTFVERNKDKIRGVVLTHGHEDHIGSLPYLLKQINVPVYGTRLTLGLVEGKLREHGILNKAKLNVIHPGDVVQMGCMSVEAIHVNHSIPDAVAFAIRTPSGTIVMTGDFKIDCTPIQGEMIDLARFAELGKEGVLALMADSTNAERPGYTKSERSVGESFDALFKKAEHRRIIIATFASNVHRVQQIIDAAVHYGRKVAVSGRSMVNVVNIGMELGYLSVPDGVLVDIDVLNRYPKDQVVIITTGSQGEPMSALTRMAMSDHRKVVVGPDDYIIISANPIPGNEKTVGHVVNELMKHGCEVVYEKMYEVHVSGHACQEELKIMLGIVKPKFFIPVHGEQKHLHKHMVLAKGMGIPADHILISEIGKVVELTPNSMKVVGTVPAGRVLVDGLGVGDVGSIVLRDRKHLAEDGLIVVVASIDAESGFVVSGPDIVSRGFVYVRESEMLMDDAKRLVRRVLEDCADKNVREWGTIKNRVREDLSRLLYERTKRSPMILPIIMEV